MEEKFNLKTVKVVHTKEGTIFEAVTVITLVISLVLALISHHLSDVNDIIGILILGTISLVLLWNSYKPSRINITGVSIKNIRQVSLAIRLNRIVAFLFSLLVLSMVVIGSASPLLKPITIGWVVVIGLIGFLFIYLIQKAE
ncbi:MAG: hypothetical protein IJ548_08845 [Paludibacteraceae bacterium]|nr:hypothetical protein [Paludibacteraceae bacterium]MBQ8714304.1 hypothetical protein [Prevotella sp.]